MSRILRNSTVSKSKNSNLYEESDLVSDSDQYLASSDEQDVLEIDQSSHEDELVSDDFESDEDYSSDVEISQGDYHNSDGSFIWNRDHPDPLELSVIRSTCFSPGLLFPVLNCVEMVDFFCHLIDDTLLNTIIEFTNIRYDENVTLDELK